MGEGKGTLRFLFPSIHQSPANDQTHPETRRQGRSRDAICRVSIWSPKACEKKMRTIWGQGEEKWRVTSAFTFFRNGFSFPISENLRCSDILYWPMRSFSYLEVAYLSTIETILWQWGRRGIKCLEIHSHTLHITWIPDLVQGGCHKPLCKLEKVSPLGIHPRTHGLVNKERIELQLPLSFLGTILGRLTNFSVSTNFS